MVNIIDWDKNRKVWFFCSKEKTQEKKIVNSTIVFIRAELFESTRSAGYRMNIKNSREFHGYSVLSVIFIICLIS